MNVLYYNWCPIQDSEGGGIAVYQRNVLDYLASHELDIKASFLCAGFYYDRKGEPYIRQEESIYGARVYSLVNSPVYAPMRAPDVNFKAMIEDESLLPVLEHFIEVYGPFDVIHFHTFEGLSLKALAIKKKYPNTKFIYSVHNYTAICPNVMLWTEDNENCQVVGYQDQCEKCMRRYNRPNIWILKHSRRLLEKHHSRLYYYTRGIKFVTRGYFPQRRGMMPDVYHQYVVQSVQCINTYVDTVLAVSKRVRDIMIQRGIENNKVRTCYIGSRFAENARGESLTRAGSNPFGIVYMGYMRQEKGFYFFLEALEKIDKELSANMSVTFASKVTDRSAKKRIEQLEKKFRQVRLYDGYAHNQIPEILEGAHIGIVPVLWEDNLPQVAIEMISCGVPVLASSYGGASELNADDNFRFLGGNTDDFIEKLSRIYTNRDLLRSYWAHMKPLTTMDMHMTELYRMYKGE